MSAAAVWQVTGATLLLAAACAAPDRDAATGTRGVVSAATPEATAAGLRVLAGGGNAVDAAVAVAFDLAVTEPAGSGLFGQAFLLVQRPGEPAYAVTGSSRAPGATPADATAADLTGRRAATVPSFVKVLAFAHRRLGSGAVTWAELLEPAAEDAEQGFPLGAFRRESIARYAAALREDPATAAVFLRPDGSPPGVGEVIRQPALARTLRRLAAAGGDDFYRGELAAEIAADMERHDGWITAADLRSFPAPALVPALVGGYRQHTVHTLPPPAGGWVVAYALGQLERQHSDHAAAELAAGAPSRTVALAEALRYAHGLRSRSPLQDLEDYADALPDLAPGGRGDDDGETTHFCVVDGDGTVVSATLSLNYYFGAKVRCRALGLQYNDYMREFVLGDPEHPYALRPWGMPYSSMSATIVADDQGPLLALGSPGSRRIISAVVQVVSGVLDAGLDLEAAVAAPRLHVVPETAELMLEAPPADRGLRRELERRGFRLRRPLSSLFAGELDPYFGGVHAVARRADGSWRGAADPRRDGTARALQAAPP